MKRELVVFLVVGTSTVAVDFVSYRGLIGLEVVAIDMAKAIGFVVGTVFAYFSNRFWTFGNKVYVLGSAWRFSILYTSTLVINVLINSFLLKALADTALAMQLAFMFATGISAALNFLGMKFFVFKSIQGSELS